MTELETIKRKILLKEQALFLTKSEEEVECSKISADIENLWQQYRRLHKQQCHSQFRTAMIMNPRSISSHCGIVSENQGA